MLSATSLPSASPDVSFGSPRSGATSRSDSWTNLRHRGTLSDSIMSDASQPMQHPLTGEFTEQHAPPVAFRSPRQIRFCSPLSIPAPAGREAADSEPGLELTAQKSTDLCRSPLQTSFSNVGKRHLDDENSASSSSFSKLPTSSRSETIACSPFTSPPPTFRRKLYSCKSFDSSMHCTPRGFSLNKELEGAYSPSTPGGSALTARLQRRLSLAQGEAPNPYLT